MQTSNLNYERDVLIRSGVAFITTAVFTTASPVAGAVFIATANLVKKSATVIFDNNKALEILASFASGLAIANLIGRVTILQALAINVLSGVTMVGLTILFPFAVIGGGIFMAAASV